MLKGGAALRLVKFATTLVGHWPGGLGVAILSTSQGIMTGQEARRRQVGGEILCYVW